MSLGVGDRPFPGAHLTHEALLEKLGIDDYGKLLHGKLPWTDPRVADTLRYISSLIDAGSCPTPSPASSSARRTRTSTPTRAR